MLPKHGRGVPDDDWKYQCCCGASNSISGCRIIAIVELVATIIAAVLLVVFYCVFHSDTYAYQLLVSVGSLSIGIICCIGALVGIACLMIALRTENPTMMLPHMAAQVFALIGMGFAIIASIIMLEGWSGTMFGPDVYLKSSGEGRTQDQYAAQTTGPTVAGIIVSLSVVGFILESWFFIVVFSAYRYLKSRSDF